MAPAKKMLATVTCPQARISCIEPMTRIQKRQLKDRQELDYALIISYKATSSVICRTRFIVTARKHLSIILSMRGVSQNALGQGSMVKVGVARGCTPPPEHNTATKAVGTHPIGMHSFACRCKRTVLLV